MANQAGMSGAGAGLPDRQPKIFELKIRDDFSDDFPAVCHEAGHALAWLSCGGKVNGFVFGRNDEGRLGGKTEIGFPPGRVAETEENARLFAERLLAGEAAVRLLLGAGRDLICSYEVVTHPRGDVGIIIARLDEFVLKRGLKGKLDIRQVLDLASKAAKDGWYAWVGERLKGAPAGRRKLGFDPSARGVVAAPGAGEGKRSSPPGG